MASKSFDTYISNLKYDLPAGLVVFLVALPLCLGISLASGAPFFSGILAGVIGGVVIGLLGNSQLSVSGPAAGLVAVVISAIATLGSFEAFLLTVFIAGFIQIAFGLLKAGIIANYFPSNVIKGMLSGIGIIIILKQIPHALGYDKDIEGDLAFLQIDGENSITGLISAVEHIDIGATLIAVIGLLVILLFENPKLKNISKIIPGGLAAVFAGVFVNEALFKTIDFLYVGDRHKVSVPVPSSVTEFLGFFSFPDFSQIQNPQVWVFALTIAAVASIESLLCIEAIDKLDPENRVTNTNRELIAQGIGNSISGMFGGLPITSVIVRSSANLNAKGKTKVSTIFHGLLLFGSVVLIPGLLNKIPLAALAAILLHTGYKLAKPSIFKQMFKNGRYQWLPFVVTILAVVFLDLLKGVSIGLGVSIVYILYGNFRNSYFFNKESHQEGDTIKIRLSEEVSFLNKASIRETLDRIPDNSNVLIDASNSSYIDFDVLEILKEFIEIKAPIKKIKCETIGMKDNYELKSDKKVVSISK